MGTKGEISKCMLNVCVNVTFIYIYIYVQFDRIFIECFASILRCFHLKVILHGFVHFAWIFACVFIGTLFSKLIRGPQPPVYFEPLLC